MEDRTCVSCRKSIKKGAMCGPCFAVCKKYYRNCAVCGANDIKPEQDDNVITCGDCVDTDAPKNEWTCTKCPNKVDAKWHKTCTDCWKKENAKGGGVCKSCNKKLDEDWKTQCTICWKKGQEKAVYPCVGCGTNTGQNWKKRCDTCYAKARVKR